MQNFLDNEYTKALAQEGWDGFSYNYPKIAEAIQDMGSLGSDIIMVNRGGMLVPMNKDVWQKFTQANTQQYGDPLIMDLDGDGIETVAADGSVLFDHDADGVKTGTGWAGADDGLLVRDLDGDGDIESGRELFGDNTIKADGTKAKDGFDALSDLDSNADGVFDANDTAFDEVKVWQDKNQDGISQADEMMSLDEAGISNINLNTNTVNKSVAGGILRKTATVTNIDGTTSTVGAMDFAENKFYSKFQDVLEKSQELQDSINVQGQGALRSLHESASLSPELNNLLTGLYSGTTPVTDAAIHEVLLEWTKTSQDFTTSLDLLDGVTLEDGTQINVGISDRVRNVIEQTAILEALNGDRLLDYQVRDYGSSKGIFVRSGSEVFDFAGGGATVAKGGIVTLNDWDFHRLADNARATNISQGYASALNSIRKSIETSFIVREVQPFLLENLAFELDDTGDVALSFDGINQAIMDKMKADPLKGINFYQSIVNAKDVTLLKDGWDGNTIFDSELFDSIDNYIVDAIESNLGEGLELVTEISTQAEGLLLEKGWNKKSLLANKISLVLSEMLDGDIIHIDDLNFTLNGEPLIFNDAGKVVINGTATNDNIKGTKINDVIHSGNGADTLEGGSGDDYLHGGNQSDTLLGGDGNDTLVGDSYSNSTDYWTKRSEIDNRGHDVLSGGKGDDSLAGGYGADTYIFNKGDGVDTITEIMVGSYGQNWYNNERDTIKFGEGIEASDLNFNYDGNDVHVTFNGSDTDKLILKNFQGSTLETFEFSDGSRLTKSSIKIGTSLDDILLGNSNDNVISGNEGDDIITGGQGDDIISGGDGADTYIYSQGDGNDILKIGSTDGSEDTLKLTDIDHDDILFSRDGDNLSIGFSDNIWDSIEVNDYFSDQFNNDGLIIDANDEFQMQLSANSAKIRELLAGGAADDSDGGSVGGTNQVNTVLNSSQLSDLWIPKESNQ